MDVVYFCLVSDILAVHVPAEMSPACETHECVLERINTVEELLRIFYDICHSDPRWSQKIRPMIAVSSDGSKGFRRRVSQVFWWGFFFFLTIQAW